MSRPLHIRGGAGPYETAAVVAAIHRLLAEEAAERATPPAPSQPPAWVRSGFRIVPGEWPAATTLRPPPERR